MSPTPLLSVTDLRKSFGDQDVLRDIDFTVDSGTVTVLLGPSGSGKTTVLRSLNTLEVPDSGVVRIDDVEVDFSQVRGRREAERDFAQLRRQSAMVFQSHHLFPHRTVLENLSEGPIHAQGRPEAEVVPEARALLEQVGLADREDAFPSQLSGGQQQRVGIARALALKPKLMLFDEPTSSLDPELVGEVLGVMKDLAAEGWTMVVVTHEIRFAQQVSDQVLFLDNGVIAERGPAAQVIGDPQEARTRQFLQRILDPI
ncbi:amino acid ABC transporter ATP-binding protein [Nocardioides sp. InS609-2]|uniref:amino acid ABC transporter ATP-binding protein n=1 Tax=Nocardioides sp. InS609-2 TaxID=2760705 RepID=UPI0024A6EF55|nr:amino acid ABC transporter ATP-binding protein [Nocardioides sp. InS609-2]